MKRYIKSSTQRRIRFADWKIRHTLDTIMTDLLDNKFSRGQMTNISSSATFLAEDTDTWTFIWYWITLSGKCTKSARAPKSISELYADDLGISWDIELTNEDKSEVICSGSGFNTIRDAQRYLVKAMGQRKDFNVFNPDLMNGL